MLVSSDRKRALTGNRKGPYGLRDEDYLRLKILTCTLPDENTLRAKKNYDRDDPGRIFTEAVPSSRSSQDFAGSSGCHRTPRHATRDPAGTAVSDPRSMIKLARLSWRRAHPSDLAGRDAAASHQRSR